MGNTNNDIDPEIYDVEDITKKDDVIKTIIVKEREDTSLLICPKCGSKHLKHLDPKEKWLYCIYENEPVHCLLKHRQYYCYICADTIEPEFDIFGKKSSRDFTAAFINYVIEDWLSHREDHFRDTANKFGISHTYIAGLHKELYEMFSEKHRYEFSYAALLYTFKELSNPKFRQQRAVIYTKESAEGEKRLLGFYESYTNEGLTRLLEKSIAGKDDKTKLVCYSYLPGAGDKLSAFFEGTECVAFNCDELQDAVIQLFSPYMHKETKKKFEVFVQEVRKTMTIESGITNDEKAEIGEKWNALIDCIAAELPQNDENRAKLETYKVYGEDCAYFVDIDTLERLGGEGILDNPLFEEIQDMIADKQSFYTIALKFMYDNTDFKDKIIEALNEITDRKKAEYLTKRLKRHTRWFLRDERGLVMLPYGSGKKPAIAKMFEIWGMPEIRGFSRPV